MTGRREQKRWKKERINTKVSKRVLATLTLAPLLAVAEYFVVLHGVPYSPFITTENAFFYALVGTGLTLISLHLIIRAYRRPKKRLTLSEAQKENVKGGMRN